MTDTLRRTGDKMAFARALNRAVKFEIKCDRLQAINAELVAALSIAAITLETIHLNFPSNIAAKTAATRARAVLAKTEDSE